MSSVIVQEAPPTGNNVHQDCTLTPKSSSVIGQNRLNATVSKAGFSFGKTLLVRMILKFKVTVFVFAGLRDTN